MAESKVLQEKLYAEMTGRLDPNEASLPVEMDGYWYQSRYQEGKEYPIHVRFQGSEHGPEQLVIDVNALAEGKSYCQVASMVMTRDHQRMAYAVDFVSRRQYTLKFREIATGVDHEMEIPDTSGAFAWADDGRTFFYATKDSVTLRVDKIWRHSLDALGEPVLIFHEKDESFSCTVYRGKTKKYLMISTSATNVDEVWFLSASEPLGDFQCITSRTPGLEYSASHHGSSWWIRSNLGGRTNFALFQSPEDQPGEWSEVIPHRADVLLEGIEYDDRSQAEEAIRACERLVSQDKVDFMLPPWGTGQNLAVAPIFRRANMPQLAASLVVDVAWAVLAVGRLPGVDSARWRRVAAVATSTQPLPRLALVAGLEH
jgi:oligopeptidase B